MNDDTRSAAPAVLALEGDLTPERFGAVSERIEDARRSNVPLIVDLGDVRSIDSMIAMDLVLFLRRRLRHGTPFAVVVPRVNPGWITGAGSLAGALFCDDRADAIRLLQEA